MAFANNMTKVVNNTETMLGLKMLKLPPELSKEKWVEDVIVPITLITFSRFFPNQTRYRVDCNHPMKNGWYYIDEERVGGLTILGIQDIDWDGFDRDFSGAPYGMYDSLYSGYDPLSIGLSQCAADVGSLFNNGIFVEYQEPNMFRLTSAVGPNSIIGEFFIKVITTHNPNLTTISPTMMQTFEDLARADIAGYLYNNLKYWDGLETAYATMDLKLDKLQEEAGKRDEIIQLLKESYVSASNKSIPFMMTV